MKKREWKERAVWLCVGEVCVGSKQLLRIEILKILCGAFLNILLILIEFG